MPQLRHLKFLLFLAFLPPFDLTANELREVLAPGPPGTRYSIQFVRLNTGQVLYQEGANQPQNPASNAKLVTAAAALRLLGPDFRFKTNFFSRSSLVGGVLHDLWIKGYGNPVLVTEELPKITAALKREGLREIRGNVYYDDSYFDGKVTTSYASDVSSREYRIMTTPLAFNFNREETDLPKQRKHRRLAKRAPRPKGTVLPRKTNNPAHYAASTIIAALQEEGIRFTGSIERRAVPVDAGLLWTHESPPLRVILKSLGKFSNNFTAEQILKTVGAVRFGPPGSTEKGIGVLQEYLDSLGIPRSSYFLENGSGLSKRSRFTAGQLIRVLSDMYNSPLREDFISSLSISGVDGTIKKRFRNSALRGEIFAKTGSLAGVVALSGYWPAARGGIVAFSILMNGPNLSYERAVSLEERIFNTLATRLEGRP